MEIRFFGGEPHEAYAYVYCIGDIDLEDVHSITDFETMHIYREGGKRWTKRTVEEAVKEVRADLAYDGDEVDLEYSYDRNLLHVDCSIQG